MTSTSKTAPKAAPADPADPGDFVTLAAQTEIDGVFYGPGIYRLSALPEAEALKLSAIAAPAKA